MSELVMGFSRQRAGGLVTGTAGRIATAWGVFRKSMRARDTIAQLRSLDDRTLKDIGIHRSEILSIGSGAGFDRLPRLR
jgi:uncharacterized protein YjiS (DUF1127 family)